MYLIKKKYLLLIFLSMISFIVSLRGGTRDTYNYKNIFENINYYNLTSFQEFYSETGMELGYGYLSFLVHYFFESHYFIFYIISFLTMYLIYKSVNVLKINYLYFLIIYLTSYFFFMHQFMQIRQGLATALVFFGAFLFLNKNYSLSVLLFLMATYFHQSAFSFIIFFVLYIVLRNFLIKFENNIIFYLSLFFSVTIILKSVLWLLPNYFVRIQIYTDSIYSQELSPFRLTSLRFYLLYIIFLIFLKFKNNIDKKIYGFLLLVYTLGLSIRVGLNDFAILSTRLSEIFLFSEIFILGIILTSIKKKYSIPLAFVYLLFQIFIFFNQFDYLLDDYFKEII